MSDENYVKQALGCLGWVVVAVIVVVVLATLYLYNLKMM
jgi:hypothetical protein